MAKITIKKGASDEFENIKSGAYTIAQEKIMEVLKEGMETNLFTPEDEKKLKKIGECIREIDKEQEIDEIIIEDGGNCKTIIISSPCFFFGRYSNSQEWQLLNELVDDIEIYGCLIDGELIAQIEFSIFGSLDRCKK